MGMNLHNRVFHNRVFECSLNVPGFVPGLCCGCQRTLLELMRQRTKKNPEKPNGFTGLMYFLVLLWTSMWCRRRDSNSHDRGPLPPQDSVSTSSTTSALSRKTCNLYNHSLPCSCCCGASGGATSAGGATGTTGCVASGTAGAWAAGICCSCAGNLLITEPLLLLAEI